MKIIPLPKIITHMTRQAAGYFRRARYKKNNGKDLFNTGGQIRIIHDELRYDRNPDLLRRWEFKNWYDENQKLIL